LSPWEEQKRRKDQKGVDPKKGHLVTGADICQIKGRKSPRHLKTIPGGKGDPNNRQTGENPENRGRGYT